MGIKRGVWIDSLEELDNLVKGKFGAIETVKGISVGNDFQKDREEKTISWETIIDKLAILPNLQNVSLSQQYFQDNSLQMLEKLKHLKGLSLYWSDMDGTKFFSQLPTTLEDLNFQRTAACEVHSTEEFKQLLERLTHLKSLNLASTNLRAFPRLTNPHEHLTILELFHHDCGGPNKHLKNDDLLNIFYNFPNLKSLNIIDCSGININDPSVKEAIKKFADVEESWLSARGRIGDYFVECKNKNYVQKHFAYLPSDQLDSLLNDSKIVEKLTTFEAKFLLEKVELSSGQKGIGAEALMQLFTQKPKVFDLLTSSNFYDFIKEKVVDFDSLVNLISYCESYHLNLEFKHIENQGIVKAPQKHSVVDNAASFFAVPANTKRNPEVSESKQAGLGEVVKKIISTF